jgi:hypothetical protein
MKEKIILNLNVTHSTYDDKGKKVKVKLSLCLTN